MASMQHILCPIDFSDFSGRALDYAVAFAGWYGAEVHALHVATEPPPAGPALLADPYPRALAAPQKAALLEALRQFITREARHDVRIATEVEEGRPAERILRAAADLPADLVVLGTHGRSGFDRVVLGSVTEKVLRKASCPVLTIPRQAHGAPPTVQLVRKVLCAIDFSDSAALALRHALALAREADATVVLLHVVEEVHAGFEDASAFAVPEFRRQLDQDARRQLEAAVPSEARSWCAIRELVVHGRAARRILDVAAEQHADLVAMGGRGRHPIDRLLFGSTVHHVIREASCPVLTVRAA